MLALGQLGDLDRDPQSAQRKCRHGVESGRGTIFVPGAVVASDENNPYFAAVSATQTPTGPTTITSYPKSGAPPVQIYTTPNFVTNVVTANGRLYWVETFDNDVNPSAAIRGMRYP